MVRVLQKTTRIFGYRFSKRLSARGLLFPEGGDDGEVELARQFVQRGRSAPEAALACIAQSVLSHRGLTARSRDPSRCDLDRVNQFIRADLIAAALRIVFLPPSAFWSTSPSTRLPCPPRLGSPVRPAGVILTVLAAVNRRRVSKRDSATDRGSGGQIVRI